MKTQSFFICWPTLQLIQKVQNQYFIKTTGHEKLKINAMLSVLVDGRNVTPFVFLKRENLAKEKLANGITLSVMTKDG
jgi:hypothetical protein